MTESRGVVVTLLGEHAPFADDVAQCLVVAALSFGVTLELVFAGQFYLCKGSSGGCGEDTAKAWFQDWLSRWEAGEHADTLAEADGLHKALVGHPHARAAEPDVFVCGDSAIFCWLLRRRGAQRERLARIPALHMLGMQLLQYVPGPWREEMMLDFREWWVGRLATEDEMAVFMETLCLQLQWQLGVVLPFVPSLGPAARLSIVHDPPRAGEVPEVLVLRSIFWTTPAGHVFDTLLRRMAAANAARQKVHFDWMGNFATQLSSGSESGAWRSFEWMAGHTCALYIPTELSQIKFRDIYSMGLPALVPDDRWLLRLLRHMFEKWGQLQTEYRGGRFRSGACGAPRSGLAVEDVGGCRGAEGDHAEVWRSVAAVETASEAWPHAPFYEPQTDSFERLVYWHQLADVKRYPHVTRFGSLGELLERVVHVDWQVVGDAIRAHFEGVIAANVGRYYRQSLAVLLGPAAGT